MLKKVTLLLATSLSLFALHTVELNINQKDLGLGFGLDIGQFNDNVEPNTTFVGMKMFFPDTGNPSSSLGSKDPYFEGNFLIMRPIGDAGLSLGIGFKLNYTQEKDVTFMSLPIGLETSYELPFPEFVPMFLDANIYYAVEVLSFLDAQNYVEYGVSYNVEMIDKVILKVGYRNINTNYFEIGESTYNVSFNAGVEISF